MVISMSYTFADRCLDSIDELIAGLRSWTASDPTSYFPIASAFDENTLALYSGSLMSVIKLDGYYGEYFPNQFETLLSEGWEQFFRNRMGSNGKGLDILWFYESDHEGIKDTMRDARKPQIDALLQRGIDIEDVLLDEADLYASQCVKETQYLIVITHLSALSKIEQKAARKHRKSSFRKDDRAAGADAIAQSLGYESLHEVHEQHVNSLLVFMSDNTRSEVSRGYLVKRLDAYQALKIIYSTAHPHTFETWEARLQQKDTKPRNLDKIPLKTIQQQYGGKYTPRDFSLLLPPRLSQQMLPSHIKELGKYAILGDRIYAPYFVKELALDPQPVEHLIRQCYQRRLPFRIVYSILGDPTAANSWNINFANIFTFGMVNRQINNAVKALASYVEQGGVQVGYSIAFTTWANLEVNVDLETGKETVNLDTVMRRSRDLETLFQQWGQQQVSNVYGCAAQQALSTCLGYHLPVAAPAAPQTERDVLRQLPISRPVSIWKPQDSMWFRTSTGVLNPYQPFSKKQSSMVAVVLGGMGYGKSNLLSDVNFCLFSNSQNSQVPYLRGLDFGASSTGVIDLMASSLPESQKHQVIFKPFVNDGSMVKNLFDTRLGCRYPLTDHKQFLIGWLQLICEELSTRFGVTHIANVITAAIERMYAETDPRESHLYSRSPFNYAEARGIEGLQEVIEANGIEIDGHTTWWEVVDALIAVGLENDDQKILYIATCLQRLAVPKWDDLCSAVNALSNQFSDLPEVDGKPYISAVSATLTGVSRIFPCFVSRTNFDVSESPVCVFDMTEVYGRVTSNYDLWKRGVVFTVAYRVLCEDLFINRDIANDEMRVNADYLGLSQDLVRYHINFYEKQDSIPKLFWADEVHRLDAASKSGDSQASSSTGRVLSSLCYEGRKFNVGIMLGSQLPQHIPEDILTLLTSLFIFGANQSVELAEAIKDKFGLSEDERDAILRITPPNAVKGAEVFCEHRTRRGTQRLITNFLLGSIKRWAYATEADERALRATLYSRTRPSEARKLLATHVQDLEFAINSIISKEEQETGRLVARDQAIEILAANLLLKQENQRG